MIEIKETKINNVECRCCSSTDIIKVELRESYSAMDNETAFETKDEYYYCKECGIMMKFIKT